MTFDNNQQVGHAIANGAIGAFLGVFRDPDLDDQARQATANVRCIGIGPDYAVADGEAFQYFWGGVAQLKLGGTVVRGDRLKTDANGKGVTLATGGSEIQNVIGLAQRSGVDGDVIPVQIELWQEQPGEYLS